MKQLITQIPSLAFATLDSSPQGLSLAEAKQRQQTQGFNEVSQAHEPGALLTSLYRATNPLIAILLIAATLSAFTQNTVNAIIIFTMVFISIVLDYYQTRRSRLAAQRLQACVALQTTVLRDNLWSVLPPRELVPGDIIHLAAGDLVPADAILITSNDLHVQQAALTGESLPTRKDANYSGALSVLPAEAHHAVFLGSSIVSGHATALVIATGHQTQFGEIAKSLMHARPPTDFERGTSRFGLLIMKTVIFLVIYAFIINIVLHHALLESLLFSVALAVGMTPEFLPMITTVTLATAAVRMSQQKVIVKNLAAIQNFGSIDILCCDKTGTLTRGEMTLEHHLDPSGTSSEDVLVLAHLNSLFETGIKNAITDALLQQKQSSPLNAAILEHDNPNVSGYTKIEEIPFDFERRRASVVVENKGVRRLITKGAPEQLLKICSHLHRDGKFEPLTDTLRLQSQSLIEYYNTQGYRVIAVAYREVLMQGSYSVADENNLIFSGFLCFIDPPHPDAKAVVQALRVAGVDVKIITGDNDLVAKHVCQSVGLEAEEIILGEAIDKMTDIALGPIAEKTAVFARVTPMQKQRIILALRSRAHVVGYIGDGINDAPSLHSADVGISVANAVDVARDAADIILLDNNLKVLLNGILEGRKAFGNVMKYLMMGTGSLFGNVLSMAIALAFLPFLPMLPAQILLCNLLYDVAQVTLPTDHVDTSFTKKPKNWNIDIIKKFMFFIGPISALFHMLTFVVMIKYFEANEALFQTGWFIESLATQTLIIFVLRTPESPFKSRPSLPLGLSVLSVVAFSLWLPFSPLAGYLGFVPLPATFFIFLVSVALSYLLLVQMIKTKLMRRWLATGK